MNVDVTKNTKIIPIKDIKKYIKDKFPMLGFYLGDYIVYKNVKMESFISDAFYDDIIPYICFGEVETIGELNWVTIADMYDRVRIPLAYNSENQRTAIFTKIDKLLTADLNKIALAFEKEYKRIEKLKNITSKNKR